jgi:hypothetical protein
LVPPELETTVLLELGERVPPVPDTVPVLLAPPELVFPATEVSGAEGLLGSLEHATSTKAKSPVASTLLGVFIGDLLGTLCSTVV